MSQSAIQEPIYDPQTISNAFLLFSSILAHQSNQLQLLIHLILFDKILIILNYIAYIIMKGYKF